MFFFPRFVSQTGPRLVQHSIALSLDHVVSCRLYEIKSRSGKCNPQPPLPQFLCCGRCSRRWDLGGIAWNSGVESIPNGSGHQNHWVCQSEFWLPRTQPDSSKDVELTHVYPAFLDHFPKTISFSTWAFHANMPTSGPARSCTSTEVKFTWTVPTWTPNWGSPLRASLGRMCATSTCTRPLATWR